MIEIKELSFKYGRNSYVLESLDIELKQGCIYGLLGENGVGKTTLLKILSGLLFPTRGSVRVNAFDPSKRQAKFLEQLYFLPDTIAVEEISLNVYANLNKGFYPLYSEKDMREYVSIMEVDATKNMSKLSFGQKKKAMLAFALACNTPFLLMDEPTNGLDIPSKALFRKIIAKALTDEKCFVVSTHQVKDVERLIDPIIIMEKQRILLNNSSEKICEKLWFGICEEKPAEALYSEDALGGYFIVKPNNDKKESKINIEALFNAAVNNKALFMEMFKNKL